MKVNFINKIKDVEHNHLITHQPQTLNKLNRIVQELIIDTNCTYLFGCKIAKIPRTQTTHAETVLVK